MFPVAQWFFLYFSAKSNRRYRRLTEIIRACALRIDLKWVYHPECTKRLIIGIIQTVTEAYELHRLLADLRRKNGMVKTFFIHLHPSYSLIRIYKPSRFAKKNGWFSTFMHKCLVKTIGIISYCWTLMRL